jgi:uncharacterized membrane protein YhaH (DUF805 family)
MLMNLGQILFSFRGRINRAKWWLSVLVTIIIYVLLWLLTLAVTNETFVTIITLIVMIVVLWITLAAGATRLHDLNRTGAWLVLFVGGPILLGIGLVIYMVAVVGTAALSTGTIDPADVMRLGGGVIVFIVLYLALVVWALIWFGCLRGTVGPNQYGPDPLEGRI